MTDAPAQPGQPDQEVRPVPAHGPGVPPPPDGQPVAPVWLPGRTQPLPPVGADAWQGGLVPADPGAGDPGMGEPWAEILPPPEVVRTHRTAVVVLGVLLGLVLAAGSGLTWYLLRVNAAWQDSSRQWQALAEQHGADLARAQADLEATRTELAAVHDQLATAQKRITQLADEKAQLGDESAAQQQLADYQARVSTAAGQVATALATCIDGQEALITYLDSGAADPASLASYRQDVQSYCGNARDANAQLQAELGK